jgi:hypothetical protein
LGAQAVEIAGYLHGAPASESVGPHYCSPAVGNARFTMISFKFTYSPHGKFAYRAHCLDRRIARLNAVTNRPYIRGDNGAIRTRSGQSGQGMNAMLASLAAKNKIQVFDDAPAPDLVEGRPVTRSSASTLQRCETIAGLGNAAFASEETLKYAPLDHFAAPGALSFSDVKGQKEYHADF